MFPNPFSLSSTALLLSPVLLGGCEATQLLPPGHWYAGRQGGAPSVLGLGPPFLCRLAVLTSHYPQVDTPGLSDLGPPHLHAFLDTLKSYGQSSRHAPHEQSLDIWEGTGAVKQEVVGS